MPPVTFPEMFVTRTLYTILYDMALGLRHNDFFICKTKHITRCSLGVGSASAAFTRPTFIFLRLAESVEGYISIAN